MATVLPSDLRARLANRVDSRGDESFFRRGDDSGVATTELVILFPLVFLLMMFIVQVSLYFSAVQIVRSAAEAGTEAGRFVSPDNDAGCEFFGVDSTDAARVNATLAATNSYLASFGTGNMSNPRVDPSGTSINCQQVTVTVRAEVNMMVGGTIQLRVSAGSPVERFRPDI